MEGKKYLESVQLPKENIKNSNHFKIPEIKLQISNDYSDSVLPILLSTTALIFPKSSRFINQALSRSFSSIKKLCEVSDSSNVCY